jgi:hypothetical protein
MYKIMKRSKHNTIGKKVLSIILTDSVSVYCSSSRITPLGGLDVDFICRRSKEEIREYTIKHIE